MRVLVSLHQLIAIRRGVAVHVMCYRLGYTAGYPHSVDIHFDREIYGGSDKLYFYRVPRRRAKEPLFVEDLFMIPGITGAHIIGSYTVQIVHGAAFSQDALLLQALRVIHMHFCPMEEMRELDPVLYSKEKGNVYMGLPPEELKMFLPFFDSVDFDTTL